MIHDPDRNGTRFEGPAEQARPRRSLLARLFGSPPPPERTAFDMRERTRHAVQGRATLTELNRRGQTGRSWQVEIMNMSKGGAAVSSSVFVAPGTAVMIEFPPSATGPGKHVMATVLHIRRLDEVDFVVGLKFEARGGKIPEGTAASQSIAL